MANREPAPLAEPEAQDRRQRRWDRTRTVRVIVNVLCGLFAVVLVAQIVLVMGEANSPTGSRRSCGFLFRGVLGFDNLFTPAGVKVRVLLNDGFAALVWLALDAVVTTLIRRFALPSPRGLVR